MIGKRVIPSVLFLVIAALIMNGCRELEEPGDNNQETPKEDVYIPSESPDPFSWVAIDGQGNTIDPDYGSYPNKGERGGKVVAVFYFLWHGCHGYDTPANYNSVRRPTSSDTKSPYDIQKLLDQLLQKKYVERGEKDGSWRVFVTQ